MNNQRKRGLSFAKETQRTSWRKFCIWQLLEVYMDLIQCFRYKFKPLTPSFTKQGMYYTHHTLRISYVISVFLEIAPRSSCHWVGSKKSQKALPQCLPSPASHLLLFPTFYPEKRKEHLKERPVMAVNESWFPLTRSTKQTHLKEGICILSDSPSIQNNENPGKAPLQDDHLLFHGYHQTNMISLYPKIEIP